MLKHLLPALVLAAFGLVWSTAAQAATTEPARPALGKAKAKQRAAPPRSKARSPLRASRPAKKQLAKKPLSKPAQPVAAARPLADLQSRLTRPGDYRFAIEHEGRARTYRVHLPSGYNASEPAPLVVALHGGGLDPQGQRGVESLARESDRAGFIAVFPEAYKAPGKSAGSWNAGSCCGDAREQNVNDVGFIEAAVANVFRQASVARDQIYATGMSDGGMMAYRLACERPHLFRAVASVGGTDNTASCTPDKPVSVLHIHARNDPRVLFGGAPAARPGVKPRAFKSAPETVSKWAKLDGCMEAPRPVLEQAGASCEAYSYCRGQAEVQLCVTDTGGHSWPGAAKSARDVPAAPISATQAIWAFFSSH
ncbi:alpha/beta hydrolase family esterase [Ramlibacter sp.]|uniref:extracellular catalytic domain type 1 short-chain-length polyhydroxyalkanoate depolymerase n=1 Tax=Ramlibacter sp. TaxID=1917967 RepID=UPI002B978D00|nr:PHB depolymerase family esterase [Ramlibacter sp.]HWI84589.1 PHB depolymerase family esterase [Ramlibacter sp.]